MMLTSMNGENWWRFSLLIVLHQSNLTRETELTQVERKDGRETTASCFGCCRKSRWRSSRLHFLLIQKSLKTQRLGWFVQFFFFFWVVRRRAQERLETCSGMIRTPDLDRQDAEKNIASWSRDCQRRKGSVWETMVEHVHHEAEVVW